MADDHHHQDRVEDRAPLAPRAEHAGRVPVVGNPAAADVIFFDQPLAFNFVAGGGSITLTTTRQLVDTSGNAYEDRVVTCVLKAALSAIHQLRAILHEMEQRADVAVAGAIAMVTKPGDEVTH